MPSISQTSSLPSGGPNRPTGRPAASAAASLAAQLPAAAQADYPNKPVTMIVPFPAGGRTDLVGRIVAQELTKHIGRPVAVVNKPGASSVLGAREVAEAPPDGYTLGFF